jgi:DNA-binding response OmpR family regulator
MSEPQRILTIEDDAAIRRGIVDALQFGGYATSEASRGDEGLELALRSSFDLLLLDLVLPAGSGMEILRQLRVQRPTTPIIILTARGEEADRIAGLSAGADDYVVKPFSIKELLARIEAVLRRSPQRPSDSTIVSFSGGTIDFSRREIVRYCGKRRALSEMENELLLYLVRHQGRAIARSELLANVWRLTPKGISTRTIDMHIARLREKLQNSSEQPRCLYTVRGKGYMFLGSPDENHSDPKQSIL